MLTKHDGSTKQHGKKTLGSLFTGIGGFDLGFERAGWRTAWQVEINPVNRLALADRFPHAKRYEDVRACGAKNLSRVDCVTAGFPCQDISNAGSRKRGGIEGLAGSRSGLFFEVVRILREIQPTWVVLENVAALLSSNDCQDMQTVVTALAECGYLGFWRVLNASGFGVPQNRRRVFLVAGFGRYPTLDFLVDAQPVEAIPMPAFTEPLTRAEGRYAANTLLATNAPSRIGLGHEVLVAEANRWDSMVERERVSRVHGIPKGLDAINHTLRFAAGNAVVPAEAQWIAEKLNQS